MTNVFTPIKSKLMSFRLCKALKATTDQLGLEIWPSLYNQINAISLTATLLTTECERILDILADVKLTQIISKRYHPQRGFHFFDLIRTLEHNFL